ncbi:hypothetical protein CC86DRAFT_401943 [Ophiobolus disseminans]|uniref:Uncharacterized protein n=1 Tax=Ophiobolus disseminans TaxID=1469910 RepID=A0A6A7AFG9_9PLEO|nr:hypothetical protein CC86DRAFT_401943 [Ophiobolus disseminans]
MDEPYQEHYLLFSFIHRFFQRKMIPGWLTDIIDEIDEKLGVVHDDKSQKSEPLTINQDEGEPSSAFIRLTWKDTFLTNGTGQLERFLPTNLLFRSGWRIDRFLRNDSHSDVYSLSPTRYSIPDSGPKQDLEAHVFLDEYHGNCENYARRQKRRMQESGNCLDTFWYNGRHVFIMNVPRQPPQQFKMRNVEEEFPTLIDPRKCKEHAALQRRNFHGRPSFAAIIGRKTPDTRVVFQPRSMPQVKTAFEKELEQIEKTRRKKQEKQRLKRRTQRDRKLEERAREQGVSEDKMVDVAHTGGTLREVERISMGAAAGGAAAQ